MAPRFASFKTEGIKEFWVSGMNEVITGVIEDVEFVERDDKKVETFLVIASQNKIYRVELSSIRGWSEEVNRAA